MECGQNITPAATSHMSRRGLRDEEEIRRHEVILSKGSIRADKMEKIQLPVLVWPFVKTDL